MMMMKVIVKTRCVSYINPFRTCAFDLIFQDKGSISNSSINCSYWHTFLQESIFHFVGFNLKNIYVYFWQGPSQKTRKQAITGHKVGKKTRKRQKKLQRELQAIKVSVGICSMSVFNVWEYSFSQQIFEMGIMKLFNSFRDTRRNIRRNHLIFLRYTWLMILKVNVTYLIVLTGILFWKYELLGCNVITDPIDIPHQQPMVFSLIAGFAEKLFNKLESCNERFEVKVMMINLISRLIGIHQLHLFNFYPFLQRFLQPQQRGEYRIASFILSLLLVS